MYSIFTTSNASYVLLEIFTQFVAVKAKILWNNKGSTFFWFKVYLRCNNLQILEVTRVVQCVLVAFATVRARFSPYLQTCDISWRFPTGYY